MKGTDQKAEELEQLAQTIVELDGRITEHVEMGSVAKRDKAREVMERLAPTEMSVRLGSSLRWLNDRLQAELNATVETLE